MVMSAVRDTVPEEYRPVVIFKRRYCLGHRGDKPEKGESDKS